jgi:hypothetical protein
LPARNTGILYPVPGWTDDRYLNLAGDDEVTTKSDTSIELISELRHLPACSPPKWHHLTFTHFHYWQTKEPRHLFLGYRECEYLNSKRLRAKVTAEGKGNRTLV